MRTILAAAIIGAVGLLASHAAAEPSFDCQLAEKPDEIAICSDDQLAKNDLLTTNAFNQAKQINRKRAIATAKTFLKVRAACGSDLDCIANAQTQAVLDFGLLGATLPTPSAQIAETPTPASAEPPQSNPWPDAFSRRDFKLGMTLKEFKRVPFPDSDKSPSAFSVCSNEPKSRDAGYETAMLFSDVLETAGVIKCAFFFVDNISSVPMVFDAGLGLADTQVSTEFYFLPDDSSVQRLFWIQTSGPAEMAGALVPIMTKAYGEPAHRVETWQNQVGGKFDNDVYTWDNSSSEINLKHFGDKITVFNLRHTLNPLWQRFDQILDQHNTEAAKKL